MTYATLVSCLVILSCIVSKKKTLSTLTFSTLSYNHCDLDLYWKFINKLYIFVSLDMKYNHDDLKDSEENSVWNYANFQFLNSFPRSQWPWTLAKVIKWHIIRSPLLHTTNKPHLATAPPIVCEKMEVFTFLVIY